MARFFFDNKHSFREAVQKLLVADPWELRHYELWSDPREDHVNHSSVSERPDDEHEDLRNVLLFVIYHVLSEADIDVSHC